MFYLGRFPGAERLSPRDTPEVLAAFAGLRGIDDLQTLADAALAELLFRGRSLDSQDLREALVADLLAFADCLRTGP